MPIVRNSEVRKNAWCLIYSLVVDGYRTNGLPFNPLTVLPGPGREDQLNQPHSSDTR